VIAALGCRAAGGSKALPAARVVRQRALAAAMEARQLASCAEGDEYKSNAARGIVKPGTNWSSGSNRTTRKDSGAPQRTMVTPRANAGTAVSASSEKPHASPDCDANDLTEQVRHRASFSHSAAHYTVNLGHAIERGLSGNRSCITWHTAWECTHRAKYFEFIDGRFAIYRRTLKSMAGRRHENEENATAFCNLHGGMAKRRDGGGGIYSGAKAVSDALDDVPLAAAADSGRRRRALCFPI